MASLIRSDGCAPDRSELLEVKVLVTTRMSRNQNVQIIKVIAALGENDGGRRAILKAMALKQGMFSNQDVDDLLDGSSERRI